MDRAEAIKTIQLLADGVDPVTGEIFEEGSPYNHPQVIRALFSSLTALQRFHNIETRRGNLPSNMGKAWSAEEDQRLLQAFDQGIPVNELARRHARTRGGIASRLVRLGRATERSQLLDNT